jgi:hypothetical protein
MAKYGWQNIKTIASPYFAIHIFAIQVPCQSSASAFDYDGDSATKGNQFTAQNTPTRSLLMVTGLSPETFIVNEPPTASGFRLTRQVPISAVVEAFCAGEWKA